MNSRNAVIAFVGLLAAAPFAQAQTTTPSTTTTAPGSATTTTPMMTTPSTNPPGTAAGRATDRTLGTNATGTNPTGSNAGPAAASGDTNQAVATTSANAAQPAHGKNSFSMGEARRRLERRGFQNVSGLHKDNDGVWRGTGTKSGTQAQVWLDYKGNIGQQ